MTVRGAPRVLALFPGGLGDLLCCWPALEALCDAGYRLTLAAREPWFDALPAGAVAPLSIERREFADLFSTAPLHDDTRRLLGGFARVESWTGHGDPNFAARLAAASGAAVAVHPFRAMRDGEHAVEYYGRCVGVRPAVRPLPVRARAAQWAAALWEQHALGDTVLAVHPGSGSPGKNWEGMAAVAAAWRARGGDVVALLGPAEAGADGAVVGATVAVRDAPLDRVAALLARAHRYLGNDSGISHLAARIGARGVAVFGGSDPRAWRPRGGAVAVLAAPQPCGRCGPNRFCTHRLPVAAVLDAVQRA